jgi:DNA sulfur modification protein DndE
MAEMTLQRILFTPDADNRMRMLKGRTGITPNILGRMGFCLSLEEPGTPALLNAKAALGREINRYTMLGEYDEAFIALLITWMNNRGHKINKPEEVNKYFLAHMNRGIELITARLKTVVDLERLIPRTKK